MCSRLVPLDPSVHVATDGEGGDVGQDVVKPKVEDGKWRDGPRHVAQSGVG